MSEPFKREERYIVIKRKKLSTLQEAALRYNLRNNDIDTVECVVVEADWPEYETVWQMIEARVTGAALATAPATPGEMAAFGASDAAMYLYPERREMRDAFCAGAEHAVSSLDVGAPATPDVEIPAGMVPWGLALSDQEITHIYEDSKRDLLPVGSQVRQLCAEVRWYRQEVQQTTPKRSPTPSPEIAALREALKPFAELADYIDTEIGAPYSNPDMEVQIENWPYTLSVGWLYAARTAVSEQG